MKTFLLLVVSCGGLLAEAVDFHTPDGITGRTDDLGGGVWRVRLADGAGNFHERGAVQSLSAFMGETVPSFGASDGSRVTVSENPFAIKFFSRSGRLVRELSGLSVDGKGFFVKGPLSEVEGVYGFGERFDRLNQRGQKILLCSYDGWNKSDTTYAPIPFFVTTSGAGVFVNDYCTMTADMDSGGNREWRIEGDGRRVDLYVWATDRMLDAVKGVHRLQGGSLTPPDWSAGPIVCRYWPDLIVLDGYFNDARKKAKPILGVGVKEMLSRYEAMGTPPKAFILEGWGLDVLAGDERTLKRRVALKECGDFLGGKGIKMLMYMRVGSPVDCRHAGFKNDFLVHADISRNGKVEQTGTENIPDVYLKGINVNPDSGKIVRSHVALDITNPEMWKWYVDAVWKELVELGVSGVKIDFCEELPDDGRTYGTVSVKYRWHNPSVFKDAAVHHAYPAFFVSRFAKEMSRLAARKNGFMVLTRGGGIGSGRNPYMWAGDQTRSWEKLDDQLLAVLNSGMSGIPFMSYDYGGYQYEGGWYHEAVGVVNVKTGVLDLSRTEVAPGEKNVYVRRGKNLSVDEEKNILSRALSLVVFMPCMQSHGFVRNVYEFDEDIRRQYVDAVEMRRTLEPYMRNAVVKAAREGVPVVQPLVLKWQDDPNTYSIEDEFMLGDDILVAPMLGPQDSRKVYLPYGEWKDRSSGQIYHVGRCGLELRFKDSGRSVLVFEVLRP